MGRAAEESPKLKAAYEEYLRQNWSTIGTSIVHYKSLQEAAEDDPDAFDDFTGTLRKLELSETF